MIFWETILLKDVLRFAHQIQIILDISQILFVWDFVQIHFIRQHKVDYVFLTVVLLQATFSGIPQPINVLLNVHSPIFKMIVRINVS